jgi:hypothetical protein
VLVDSIPEQGREWELATREPQASHPVRSLGYVIEWLTLIFAAVGSLYRAYQNERLYQWHKKTRKKKKKK